MPLPLRRAPFPASMSLPSFRLALLPGLRRRLASRVLCYSLHLYPSPVSVPSLVEMNRNNKAVGQHKCCAILGTPIGVPKIERQTEIGAVEQNRAVKAEAQQKCGTTSGVLVGGPKIEHRAAAGRKTAVPTAAWAPPAGVPSLKGEDREEFLQICDAWYSSDKGQHVPCKIVEPSCQGGQSSLVRFWCKEKVVSRGRLTREAEETVQA